MTLSQGHTLGALVRAARLQAGLHQAQLGRRCGYSASQISRWETGATPLNDVRIIRAIAAALDMPVTAFGLVDFEGGPVDFEGGAPVEVSRSGRVAGSRVGRAAPPTPEEDDVRRRQFLLASGLTAAAAWAAAGGVPAAAATPGVDPAQLLGRELEPLLLGRVVPAAADEVTVRSALAAAEADFAACRYVSLATTLPPLIRHGEALASTSHRSGQRLLAQTYQLCSRALGKLEVTGQTWVAAERGLRAAEHADDPLVLAESHRLAANVARRAGYHARAQDLSLAAAELLDPHRDAAHLGLWARLLCSAGYAAAQAGDRERTRELYDDAAAAVARMPDGAPGRSLIATNVVSHQVSAWCVLGDAGTALAHARTVAEGAVPTVERRARLLVDVAGAWAQWGKPAKALDALLAAERAAPGEVRTRAAVRRLVLQLARQPGLPALPDLARRVHVPI